jgi:CheY-like chemotaxis protein
MGRILLVDDEPELLEMVGVLLKGEGHEVIAVSEGLKAMDLIGSLEHFDMIITDLRMAPIDGLEVIALARREHPDMAVVVLSAYIDDEMEKKVRALGCAHVIKKPFSVQQIVQPVVEILTRHEVASASNTRTAAVKSPEIKPDPESTLKPDAEAKPEPEPEPEPEPGKDEGSSDDEDEPKPDVFKEYDGWVL